jgi:hypothetical protein
MAANGARRAPDRWCLAVCEQQALTIFEGERMLEGPLMSLLEVFLKGASFGSMHMDVVLLTDEYSGAPKAQYYVKSAMVFFGRINSICRKVKHFWTKYKSLSIPHLESCSGFLFPSSQMWCENRIVPHFIFAKLFFYLEEESVVRRCLSL